MQKKKDFRWRYQISLNSSWGILLDYIQKQDFHPTCNKKEMILQALSAYYMPLAYSLLAEKQPEQLKQIAYDSVFALQRQIDRLVTQFQLDRSKLEVASEMVNQKSNQDTTKMDNKVSAEQVVEAQDSVCLEEKVNLKGLWGLNTSYEDE